MDNVTVPAVAAVIRLRSVAVIDVESSVIVILISASSPAAVVTFPLIAVPSIKLARESDIPSVNPVWTLLIPERVAALDAVTKSLTVAVVDAAAVTASVINAASICAALPVIV